MERKVGGLRRLVRHVEAEESWKESIGMTTCLDFRIFYSLSPVPRKSWFDVRIANSRTE